jgi:succinoglycan biosynthesis protein ExoA
MDRMHFDARPGRETAHLLSDGIVVAIPALNEAKYIEACLRGVLVQLPDGAEIVVADGGSTDGTRAIVARISRQDPRVRLIDNPKRLQAAAMNLVARQFAGRATILIRVDAHAAYPAYFIRNLLAAYHATKATSVVVPMRTVGRVGFQRAVAAAQNSRLGNGGSEHRRVTGSRFVDHGHHALFNLNFFLSVGGYDETFSHNEDCELDWRMRAAGGRIWLCSDACIDYFPRSTAPALAQQYACHGMGRARTLLKHGLRPRLRQLAPLAAMGVCVLGIGLGLLEPLALLMPLLYVAVCLGWGVVLAGHARDWRLVNAGVAAIIMHLSWAIGLSSVVLKQAGSSLIVSESSK